MGNPVVAGRPINWDDIHNRARVVVIAENLAREVFGEPDQAVGRRLSTGLGPGDGREIIGVGADVRDEGMEHAVSDLVYWPMALWDYFGTPSAVYRYMVYAVWSPRVGTCDFLAEMRDAVWGAYPTPPHPARLGGPLSTVGVWNGESGRVVGVAVRLLLDPQQGDLCLEVGQRVERAVHACEAQVGDLVELAKRGQGGHAHLVAQDFRGPARSNRVFDLLAQARQVAVTHRTALARLAHSRDDLLATEWLGSPRSLDDRQSHLLDRGESSLALQALTTPPDRGAVVSGAAVEHPRVVVATERALHLRTSSWG